MHYNFSPPKRRTEQQKDHLPKGENHRALVWFLAFNPCFLENEYPCHEFHGNYGDFVTEKLTSAQSFPPSGEVALPLPK